MSKKVSWMPMLLSALVLVCTYETRAGAYQSPLDYASSAVFTITNYTKSADVANFPLYLKIAKDNPKGFRYEDLKNGKDDLRFLDTTGQSLPYEIVTWNESGESAFWIRVPSLRSGETITMCWNLRDGCTLPERDEAKDRESIWRDYVGVWHMDETITAATAPTTYSHDSTEHGLNAKPNCKEHEGVPQGNLTQMVSKPGVFGNARVNATESKQWGNHLEVPSYDSFQLGGVFTISAWIQINGFGGGSYDYPQLFCRKEKTDAGNGWHVESRQTNRRDLTIRGDGANNPNATITTFPVNPTTTKAFYHIAIVFNGTTASTYCDGVYQGSGTINAASDNGMPLAIGCGHFGEWRKNNDYKNINGAYDEVRLYKGIRSADSIMFEHAQSTNAFYTAGVVTNDWTAVLKNEWIEPPSITRTTWPVTTPPTLADFKATPKHGGENMYIEFYDRGTGENIGRNPPTKPGEYRAVFIVPQADGWGALRGEVAFRIFSGGGTHKIAANAGRVLLAQDDETVEGAEVSYQAYNDEDLEWHWRHLADDHVTDESTTPPMGYEEGWSVSPLYNFGGGTYHLYCHAADGVTNVLWTLDGVRVGNTFGYMCGDKPSLKATQNYLPWNAGSYRVLNFFDETIGNYARYAGQMLLQNRAGAQIVSSCYTNGIGTIYFDAVNGWTDNIVNAEGGANYELVVEVATNAIGSTRPPTDANVSSNPEKGGAAYDPFLYADWKRVPVRVLRFDADICTDLGTQDRLTPVIGQGGTVQRFYRIIAPVNVSGPARFRIRRTAIDPDWSWNPDGDAYILVDNVICSDPAARVNLSPYGLYDASLTGKSVQGWGGAFEPAFPAADDAIHPRMRATMGDGSPVSEGVISAATMHYRWHYIDQRTTDWLAADLNPATLRATKPLDVPAFPGDIEFWFEANPHGTYYEYGDYSGQELGLGGCGYSEAVLGVTNRLSATKNWFVRMREGKSAYSSMKLLVKTGEKATPKEVEMYVSANHLWRGYYKMDEALKDGIWWRIEPRDEQMDGATTWNYSTNRWYVLDWTGKLPSFPASGRMSEGETNSWSRMPCDKQTGYLMFQVEDSTRGVTVIHADYQNFNDWNEPNDFFSGSSAETNEMHGTSSEVKTYDEVFSGVPATPSTDSLWKTHLDEEKIGAGGFVGYETFAGKENIFEGWNFGKGMWVYGKYREPNSHVAYQAAGCGEGYAEFWQTSSIDDEHWPRGIGSISFKARLAQTIAPEKMSYNNVGRLTTELPGFIPGAMMTNYTLMVRGCFDRQQNTGFAGNAALSLFAYYQPRVGAYEARWEQIKGKETTNRDYPVNYLGPAPNGQRLVISRWDAVGDTYQETVLYAVTNGTDDFSFDMPKTPYKNASATNNLMPFCISVTKRASDTVIAAAVRVAGDPGGVDWNEPLNNMQKSWYFAVAVDNSSKQLPSGSYGVLTSNSEGMMLAPQFRNAFTHPADVAIEKMAQGFYAATGSGSSKVKGKTLDGIDFDPCYNELVNRWWSINPGRQASFCGSSSAQPYGFTYVAEPQTVDVYVAPNPSQGGSWGDKPIGQVTIADFGSPKPDSDRVMNLYCTTNCKMRLKTGGKLDDYRKDVVVSDVVVSQWRGHDWWSTSDKEWNFLTDLPKDSSNNYFGYTNIVVTGGWFTNGAVRLSAKRTPPGTACSVRSPLFDGLKQGKIYRGVGLGQIRFRYREPKRNIRLKVQVCTNYVEATESESVRLRNLSRSVRETGEEGGAYWTTLTNLTYETLMEPSHWKGEEGEWITRLGWHGVQGLMRIVIDDSLTRDVQNITDPELFGEIDILEVTCKDEPALDKGCWWGWNLKTVGDAHDTVQRMYLADYSPIMKYAGQSMALNNSTVAGTDPAEESAEYAKHLPFVQSPSFTNAIIGQISFKARKYELSDRAPQAKVVIYGAPQNPDFLPHDADWVKLGEFDITNTLYESFTCKTQNEKYYALRLAVLIDGTDDPPEEAKGVKNPQRVLFDEVVISESVSAMLAFRNVGAFREGLDTTGYVPGVPSREQQPLCDENWGIQAELFATMLEDEIYREREPNVTLHWFEGTKPWGYANWKDSGAAGHAKLAAADGTNFVYRSSYDKATEAVMPAQQKAGTVVQYMLEVEYWTIHSDKGKVSILPATNWLDAVAWQTPEWYAPIDYNADARYGAGKTFAGYTILDKVAPGWAWINEVNLFGTKTASGGNRDQDFQYAEVCAPVEADLSGWKLRFLEAAVNNDTVVTNNFATFGSGQLSGTKTLNMASNMVFHCVGTREGEHLKKADGSFDAPWEFQKITDTFKKHEEGYYYVRNIEIPFGVQLIRPSGIIEHSVVVVGTNRWARVGRPAYDPTNIVARLNKNVPGSRFFYGGEDCMGDFRSVGVIDSQGESPEHWRNDWWCSPGFINTNGVGQVQQIEDHPTPKGDTILVYATIDTTAGPIRQYVGGEGSTATNAFELIILKKGSETGTNILYKVDPWYEVAGVTTNGKPAWVPGPTAARVLPFTVGVGASNNITVVASAMIDRVLSEQHGLTKDNPYTPAVMDWLVGGRTLKRAFANNGTITRAAQLDLGDNFVTNLDLTGMYWLDMDPTISNQILKAGLTRSWPVPLASNAPAPSDLVDVEPYRGTTNVRMTVFMMITNRIDGEFSPYVLRGMEPKSVSTNYNPSVSPSWTSETFKVTGVLFNGKTRPGDPEQRIPLRWFVFDKDSFYQEDTANHKRFTADIEIVDPLSRSSPGAEAGWYDWGQKHGFTPVYNGWAIDPRLKAITPEMLRPENYYEHK